MDELDGNIAVCLDFGPGELQRFAECPVIVEHPVVGQSKCRPFNRPKEGMVVVVAFSISLGGHTGVAHDYSRIVRDSEQKLVS